MNSNDLLYRVLDSLPTSVNAFDYLKDPLYRNDLKALLRLYDLIPVLATTILDEIIDRLEGADLYIKTLKKDYPRIREWLQESSRRTMDRYKEDELEYDTNTVIGEYHLQMKMIDDLSRYVLPHLPKDTRELKKNTFAAVMGRGRIRAFTRRYISLLAMIEAVTSTEDIVQFKKEVIDKCIPMGQLEVGTTFMFPQAEHAMDDGGQMFTYLGLCEEDIPNQPGEKNIVCHYRKISDSIHIVYIEKNALRAVLPLPNTSK